MNDGLKKRWIILISVVGFVAAFIVLFSVFFSSDTIEVGVFTGSNWDVANANSFVVMDRAVEKFTRSHPDVKVHYYSGIRKDEYSEWFSRLLLRGNEPDVFMVLDEDFNLLAEEGVLENLESFMEEDKLFDVEKYYSTALDAGKYMGTQYALPYETVPMLMFVNKTLLNKSGIMVPDNNWTWEDFYRISKLVTKDADGDGVIDQFGSYNYSWTEAAYSNNVTLFDEKGNNGYFTGEKLEEALKFTELLNSLNQGEKVTKDDFDGGNVAFMPLPFTEYRTYKTYPYRIKKYTDFQWDCITMPAGPSGGNISAVNSLVMGISSHSNNKKLAWEFLKLMTYDEEMQMDIFRYSQGASVLHEVTSSTMVKKILQEDIEVNEKFIDNAVIDSVLKNGVAIPGFPKYEGAMNLADSEINRMLEEEDGLDNSLRLLQRQINKYLEK
ncbi:MAG: sugar ABC transporter substrate-binding protein [Lachnospiraceae bacterium]|nr:sugar ABC transporter substrate-binding protein [Lachnospiraceae bacterium]